MILKSPPQVFYAGRVLTQVIGSPDDFNKNKEKNSFPDHLDLKIPVGSSDDGIGINDLANMMESKARVSPPKPGLYDEKKRASSKPPYQGYQGNSEAAQAQNRIESHIASQHMPIKALNQFNTEWCIKARVLKKADMRNYRNDKGEGCILNLDLIDREGTMIQATSFNDTARKINDQVQ